jgi:large subunit ribosomal protein L28
MSRICQITGKKGLKGHRVSHANNKSNHVQQPNLQKRRIFVPELKRLVTVRLSVKGLREVDKKGAYRALKQAGLI